MKKEGKFSLVKVEVSRINTLIKTLEKQINDFESAYMKKDFQEFNSLKKEIIQTQRKIDSIIE